MRGPEEEPWRRYCRAPREFLCFPSGAACTFYRIHMGKTGRGNPASRDREGPSEQQRQGRGWLRIAEEPGRLRESRVPVEPRRDRGPGQNSGTPHTEEAGKIWGVLHGWEPLVAGEAETRRAGEPRETGEPHMVAESRAALESPCRSGGGPVHAGSRGPAHLSRAEPPARRPLRPARAAARPARPGPGLRLAGSPAHCPGPARLLDPVVPGRQPRRWRCCSSRTRSSPPRSSRSRSPAAGGGSSSLRAPAASSRQHPAAGQALEAAAAPTPAPHRTHLPETGNGCSAAANSRSGRHARAGPAEKTRLAESPAAGGNTGRSLVEALANPKAREAGLMLPLANQGREESGSPASGGFFGGTRELGT